MAYFVLGKDLKKFDLDVQFLLLSPYFIYLFFPFQHKKIDEVNDLFAQIDDRRKVG